MVDTIDDYVMCLCWMEYDIAAYIVRGVSRLTSNDKLPVRENAPPKSDWLDQFVEKLFASAALVKEDADAYDDQLLALDNSCSSASSSLAVASETQPSRKDDWLSYAKLAKQALRISLFRLRSTLATVEHDNENDTTTTTTATNDASFKLNSIYFRPTPAETTTTTSNAAAAAAVAVTDESINEPHATVNQTHKMLMTTPPELDTPSIGQQKQQQQQQQQNSTAKKESWSMHPQHIAFDKRSRCATLTLTNNLLRKTLPFAVKYDERVVRVEPSHGELPANGSTVRLSVTALASAGQAVKVPLDATISVAANHVAKECTISIYALGPSSMPASAPPAPIKKTPSEPTMATTTTTPASHLGQLKTRTAVAAALTNSQPTPPPPAKEASSSLLSESLRLTPLLTASFTVNNNSNRNSSNNNNNNNNSNSSRLSRLSNSTPLIGKNASQRTSASAHISSNSVDSVNILGTLFSKCRNVLN